MPLPFDSAERSQFPATHRVLQQAICDRAFPGAAYGALLRGERMHGVAGRFTYEADAPLIQPHTIFDMASVSKVMATTAMAMLLWQRGQFDLDLPVGELLPEFVCKEPAEGLKRQITPRMLLAHSSGLPAYERLFERCPTRQSMLEACLHMPLQASPDTLAVYSDIGFIVLGHLLEALAGEHMDIYCQREIFSPLGMSASMYCPAPEMQLAIPPTAWRNAYRHRLIQGEVHDDNCYVLGGISGHAGLFSNVADTLRFAHCILRGGGAIFSQETISLFTTRHSLPPCATRALGWDTPSPPSSSGKFFSANSVGHLGYTGTSLWIDTEKDLAVVLLTNRTFPGDEPEGISNDIQRVRPLFHDALMQDLGLAPARA